jgi:uncharacterized protein (DUF2252 family)
MNNALTVSERIRTFQAQLIPEVMTLKYHLLTEDLFRFFRGTNHLFYEDLAGFKDFPASPTVWLCGDLHLENFGSYKGDNRLVYFDISDFDEGILGPALWDVVRVATSIYVAFEALGISEAIADEHAAIFTETYTAVLAEGKARHIQLQTSRGVVRQLLEKVSERNVEKWLKKRVEKNNGEKPTFKNIPHKQWKISDEALKADLMEHISRIDFPKGERREDFTIQDVCFRIAGTGSLGLKRYLFLMESTDGSHWLLDMKQARPSALLPYLSSFQPAWATEAERVVGVEYRMQDVPEALLTTTVFRSEAFKIQEMQPTEDKVEFHQVKDDLESMAYVLKDMASLTASAQLRSSGRQGSAIADELISFGKTTNWQSALLAFARSYAQQVKEYYRQYLADYQHNCFGQ